MFLRIRLGAQGVGYWIREEIYLCVQYLIVPKFVLTKDDAGRLVYRHLPEYFCQKLATGGITNDFTLFNSKWNAQWIVGGLPAVLQSK